MQDHQPSKRAFLTQFPALAAVATGLGNATPSSAAPLCTAQASQGGAALTDIRDIGSPRGSSLIGYSRGGTVESQLARLTDDVVSVTDPQFAGGAKGDGINDDTAAFLAAIARFQNRAGTIYIPPGRFKITSTLTISSSRVHLVGAGSWASMLQFEPSRDSTCIQVSTGRNSLIFQGSIRGIGFFASKTLHTKIALEIVDTSSYSIEDIAISGASETVSGSRFWSGGAGSIGILIRGREAGSLSRINAYADRPIVIADNPNAAIDIDHFHFSDLYLGATNFPCITIESGVNLTDVVIDGYNAWVLGTYGLYWNDTQTKYSSQGLRIENVRTEQGLHPQAFMFHIVHNYALYRVSFRNCTGGVDTDRQGFFLRKVNDVLLESCVLQGKSNIAINADASVQRISALNCFFQNGSRSQLSDQVLAWSTPRLTGPLPANFVYISSKQSQRNSESECVQSAPTTILPAGARHTLGPEGLTAFIEIFTSEGECAKFALQGPKHITAKLLDAASAFSNRSAEQDLIAVCWDSSTNTYELQNNRRSELRFKAIMTGSYQRI